MELKVRRRAALETIQRNIQLHGHHTYVVSGPPTPRFAYTIGLTESQGFELVIAGSIYFMFDDVIAIIKGVATALRTQTPWQDIRCLLPGLGAFELRSVHPSWAKLLLLGALDFYKRNEIPVLQIIPDRDHWTIDIPDLGEVWNPSAAPAWRWLTEQWDFQVPQTSQAITDLAALQGDRITEAARWEEDEWELLAGAGPEVPKTDTRVVPTGTLLASDPTLFSVLELGIGKALWRDETSDWHEWRTA